MDPHAFLFPFSGQRRAAPALLAALILLGAGLGGCGKSPEEARAARAAEIAQTTGRLHVKTNRPGALVEATRQPSDTDASTVTVTGGVDNAISGVLPGTYTVVVRADGWPDARGEAVITLGQVTEAVINFKSGSLQLDSQPTGATVKRGATVLGKTPLLIPQLPAGDCALTLEYPGWPVHPIKVAIAEDAQSTENVRLPHGKLIVESVPAGAAVLLGKRTLGQTPLTLEQMPAGPKKIVLQGKGFPPLEIAVTIDDQGENTISRELGMAFDLLDPVALLRHVWVPDNPDRFSPSFDETGPFAPQNGIVKNLNRKRLHETWLKKSYRFAGVIKAYDRKLGQVELVEDKTDFSRYRVLARLSVAAAGDKALEARLVKGAPLAFYGTLRATEEARWPAKLITFEFAAIEPLPPEPAPAP
ncbi:MAG TPA: carboxypeptidase regulatory-like domain-containing protein [Lacunisphaera sp.]|nr:carboxypeptidase regulatory-like domain-containing protein [Lacunisphaera sp.]